MGGLEQLLVVEGLLEQVDVAVAPMDGFHLSNETLSAGGLPDVKGAPETFEVDSFVRMLERARDGRATVLWRTWTPRRLCCARGSSHGVESG